MSNDKQEIFKSLEKSCIELAQVMTQCLATVTSNKFMGSMRSQPRDYKLLMEEC